MSKTADDASTDRTSWEELSHARQRLLKTVAYMRGDETFERPPLQADVRDDDEVEEVIDDKERVLKSLNNTGLLNRVEEDGYLRNIYQGGNSPIVLDLGYDEGRDDQDVAPFGATADLHTLVDQIFDREGIQRDLPANVDEDDFNKVVNAVNRIVGRTTLVTVSESSQYEFCEEALEVVSEKL